MSQGVITVQGQVALLREGIRGPTWSGAQVVLFTDNNPMTVNDPWGMHTEANFTGYARQLAQWGIPGYDPTPPPGADVAETVVHQWQGPGDGSGQTITGWGVVQAGASGPGSGSAGPPMLLAVGSLDRPTTVAQLTDILPLSINLDGQFQANGVQQT